jgi:DNA-binding NtrC family response regulator
MQPKLLRVLESRSIRRVGESQHRSVDVRFVAATHRNLAELVAEGAFREDLYFRLAVLLVSVPPLREHLEDVPALAAHFCPPGATLSATLVEWMRTQPWRGNVRELRNFVERAVALGEQNLSSPSIDPAVIEAAHAALPSTALPAPDLDRAFKDVRDAWLDHLEREYVRGWLARTGGNVSAAAEAMGLNRTYVHRLVKKHDLGR